MSTRVAVVVLHYNRPQGAIECVKSLHASTHDAFEVAVLDNGSDAVALDELRRGLETLPFTRLIGLAPNRGYTGGMNAALQQALSTGAPYLWLLADDVFVDSAAMAAQASVFDARPSAGLAGALTYYASDPERIWFAGGYVPRHTVGRAKLRGLDTIDSGQFKDVEVVEVANGSSLFMRRAVAERVGLFDEDYFTYWEDTDWSARVAEQGDEVLFVPAARIWHHVTPRNGPQLDAVFLYESRNRMIWHQKHRPERLRAVILWTLLAIPVWFAMGRFRMALQQWRGLVAWCRGSRGRIPI